MHLIFRFLVLVTTMMISTGFSLEVAEESIFHSFKAGKMQCQAQIDSNGQTVILLKTLTNNTWIDFQRIIPSQDKQEPYKYLLEIMMHVKADTDLCGSWIDIQSVTIAIHPQPVSTITLTGKPVYQENDVTILIPDNQESVPTIGMQ